MRLRRPGRRQEPRLVQQTGLFDTGLTDAAAFFSTLGRLAALVGTWQTDTTMAAMPGVPGMEQPTEMAGTERAEPFSTPSPASAKAMVGR